jgi:hypothetical protein
VRGKSVPFPGQIVYIYGVSLKHSEGEAMSRQMIGRGLAVFALVSGLGVLAVQATQADNTSATPSLSNVTETIANAGNPETGTIDTDTLLNTRTPTPGIGSKFRPKP